jgi:tetratricopeptide (TPR) repeat protein
MKNLLIIIFSLFLFSQNLFATQEEKKLYKDAMKLIDSYNGDSAKLYKALYKIEQLKRLNSQSKYYFISYAEYLRMDGFLSGRNYKEDSLVQSKIFIEKALEVDPDFFDTYYLGVFTYLYSSDLITTEKFIKKLEALSKTKEDSVKILHVKSAVAEKEKKFDLLISYSKQILEENISESNNLSAMYELAFAYENTNKYDEAEEYYKKIINIEPSAWNFHNFANFYYYRKKDYDKAIEYEKQALSIANFPLARKILGKAYYKKAAKLYWDEKWYQDSLEYFLLAVRFYPTSNAYYGLGLAYYQIGHGLKDKKLIYKSKEAFERSLYINPENQHSLKQLKRVNKLIDWLKHNS